MIAGTGPGRGVPWWRWVPPNLLVLRKHIGYAERESAGQPREGRTVAVIGGRR